MGILSKIGSAVKSAAVKVLSPVVNNEANPVHYALDTLQTALSHPIKTVEAIISPDKSFSELKKETTSGSVKKQITEVAIGTAGIAATVVTAGYAGAAIKSGAAAKIITSVAKAHPIATAVAVPVVGTAVISNPLGTAKAAANVLDAQVDLGKALSNPSIESAKEFISEHPIATAAAAVAAAAVVAKTAIPAAASYLQTEAIKEQTQAIEGATTSITAPANATGKASLANGIAPQTPITPATQPLIATAGGGSSVSGRRKRRSLKPVMQNLKQQVSVIVSNRGNSTTKNYLKREVLVH